MRSPGLERKRVTDEHADLLERIAELHAILSDEARLMALIREELEEIRDQFGDERRTEIVPAEGEIDLEQLIAEEDMVISITRSGYIKRLALSAYRVQGRGGIGVMGMDTKEDDYIEHLFVASTHDYLLFFTTVGKVYRIKVHELPTGNRQSKGRALVNVLPLRQDEKVRAVIDTRDYGEGKYLLFATRKGIVKKTEFKAYDTILRADGIIALKVREGDELVGVRLTDGDDDVLMVSRNGKAVRFSEHDVRAMGRDTTGRGRDEAAGRRRGDRGRDRPRRPGPAGRDRERLRQAHPRVSEYPAKGRGTMGVLTIRYTEARGRLAGAMIVRDGYEVMFISRDGTIIRTAVEGISRMSRIDAGRAADEPARRRHRLEHRPRHRACAGGSGEPRRAPDVEPGRRARTATSARTSQPTLSS